MIFIQKLYVCSCSILTNETPTANRSEVDDRPSSATSLCNITFCIMADAQGAEDSLAKQCIALEVATWDAELSASKADRTIPKEKLISAARLLDDTCRQILLSTDELDVRLMRRVSRLAASLFHFVPDSYPALCIYGALAPPHHAEELSRIYISAAPFGLLLALPAIIAMPKSCVQMVPFITKFLAEACEDADLDSSSLAASALLAVLSENEPVSLSKQSKEEILSARRRAREKGLKETYVEVERVIRTHI